MCANVVCRSDTNDICSRNEHSRSLDHLDCHSLRHFVQPQSSNRAGPGLCKIIRPIHAHKSHDFTYDYTILRFRLDNFEFASDNNYITVGYNLG